MKLAASKSDSSSSRSMVKKLKVMPARSKGVIDLNIYFIYMYIIAVILL